LDNDDVYATSPFCYTLLQCLMERIFIYCRINL